MRYEKLHLFGFVIAFMVASRLIPHLPNFTPLIALCLLAGRELKQPSAIFILITGLIISDACIALLNHYAWFGGWTFFTYTGFIATIWFGQSLHQKTIVYAPVLFAIIAGSGFWLWTNFGVWLTSGMYSLSIEGLTTCYLAALPFLRNELLGDFCWVVIVFGSLIWVRENPWIPRTSRGTTAW